MTVKNIRALACFAVVAAFGLCQGGAFAQDTEYFCPPGAKFCPAPGASAPVADTGFGYGEYPSRSAAVDNSYFQSQLNEGEQLLMVAPGGDFANVPAPGQPSWGSGTPYQEMNSHGTGYSVANTGGYGSAYSVPGSYNTGVNGYAVGYAPAPMNANSVNSGSDGFSGFMPPPPGTQPSYAPPAQPQMSPYNGNGYGGYAAAPAPMSTPMGYGSEPGPLLASSFGGQQPAPYSPQGYGEYGSRPVQEVRHAAPQGYGREQEIYAQRPQLRDSGRPAESITPDAKKRRADRLSEVANETSRRSDKVDFKPRSENRPPWWKGGFWRKNKGDASIASKKSRAEVRAERREAKLAARKAQEDGNGAGY